MANDDREIDSIRNVLSGHGRMIRDGRHAVTVLTGRIEDLERSGAELKTAIAQSTANQQQTAEVLQGVSTKLDQQRNDFNQYALDAVQAWPKEAVQLLHDKDERLIASQRASSRIDKFSIGLIAVLTTALLFTIGLLVKAHGAVLPTRKKHGDIAPVGASIHKVPAQIGLRGALCRSEDHWHPGVFVSLDGMLSRLDGSKQARHYQVRPVAVLSNEHRHERMGDVQYACADNERPGDFSKGRHGAG